LDSQYATYGPSKLFNERLKIMTAAAAAARKATTSNLAHLSRMVRNAFTMDPAASRHLENTFIEVHLNSRIWMV
jgi:hypothetical protein